MPNFESILTIRCLSIGFKKQSRLGFDVVAACRRGNRDGRESRLVNSAVSSATPSMRSCDSACDETSTAAHLAPCSRNRRADHAIRPRRVSSCLRRLQFHPRRIPACRVDRRSPEPLRHWATSHATVVLPFVPVTPMTRSAATDGRKIDWRFHQACRQVDRPQPTAWHRLAA